VSQAVRQNLQRFAPGIHARAVGLHNGIEAVNAAPAPMGEVIHFTLFGRLKPEKGQWYLLEALRYLPAAALVRTRFTLMGGAAPGQERVVERLRRLIADLGLEDQVRIVGFGADITAAMSATDVCLVPSLLRDPFPTTVLEAMSAGRPVIATNHGGAREAMIDGLTGFLVAPDDPQELADRIQRYVKDRNLIREQGLCARQQYLDHFTAKSFAQRWRMTITALLPDQLSRPGNAIPRSGRKERAQTAEVLQDQ
ncbi:MAG: glycosyltransferase family 4 protein, partial [Flavobacteriales bacterium]